MLSDVVGASNGLSLSAQLDSVVLDAECLQVLGFLFVTLYHAQNYF